MEPWATLPLLKPHPGTHCPSRKGCYLLLLPQEGPGLWDFESGAFVLGLAGSLSPPGEAAGGTPRLGREVGQPASVYVLRERTERSIGAESPLCQHLPGCDHRALGTMIFSSAVHCERLAPALFRVGLRGAWARGRQAREGGAAGPGRAWRAAQGSPRLPLLPRLGGGFGPCCEAGR